MPRRADGYHPAMTVLALLLALAAIVCFCLAMSVRARSQAPFWVPLGLALLTAAWVVQLLGWTYRIHPRH